jgi:hypothetical protein
MKMTTHIAYVTIIVGVALVAPGVASYTEVPAQGLTNGFADSQVSLSGELGESKGGHSQRRPVLL